MPENGILLTGATGFVGGDLLPRLLASRPSARVYCVLRPRGRHSLEDRRREVLEWSRVPTDDAARVVAVSGNLSDPGLGLGDARGGLVEKVNEIFHTAATTRFDLDIERARRVNCRGLEQLVAFAQDARKAGGFRRLHHLSTAYVVGEPGPEGEPPKFRNSYEQSKWESEQLLFASDVPWTCYRPSIIVGDSRTGRTRHFRVIYDPVKWVYLGGMTVLPVRTEIRFDVVPIDYVCDAISYIGARDDSEGQAYRLSCGAEKAITVAEFANLVAEYGHEWQREHGEPETPVPTLVAPEHIETLSGEERENFEKLFAAADHVAAGHLPYMLKEQVFESPETDRILEGSGIVCPPLASYMRPFIRYAADHHWGVPV